MAGRGGASAVRGSIEVRFETIDLRCSSTAEWPDIQHAAESAARHLGQGGLLAHPTLGVYGLGGRRNEKCEATISRLKGRRVEQGLVYLVSDAATARSEFPDAEWSPAAERLAGVVWPGALTLVLPDGSENGIAIRVESHPVTRAVLERFGGAMSSTSLNRTGDPPARTESEASRALESLPESDLPILMLGAGDLGSSSPSTLVRPTEDGFELLRQGSVSTADLEAALT